MQTQGNHMPAVFCDFLQCLHKCLTYIYIYICTHNRVTTCLRLFAANTKSGVLPPTYCITSWWRSWWALCAKYACLYVVDVRYWWALCTVYAFLYVCMRVPLLCVHCINRLLMEGLVSPVSCVYMYVCLLCVYCINHFLIWRERWDFCAMYACLQLCMCTYNVCDWTLISWYRLCVFVCLCIFVCKSMYVCMYVRMYYIHRPSLQIFSLLILNIHTHRHTHAHTYWYAYILACRFPLCSSTNHAWRPQCRLKIRPNLSPRYTCRFYVHLCTCTCIYMYMYIDVHVDLCTCTYVWVWVSVWIITVCG